MLEVSVHHERKVHVFAVLPCVLIEIICKYPPSHLQYKNEYFHPYIVALNLILGR